jgi:hypothetical protein
MKIDIEKIKAATKTALKSGKEIIDAMDAVMPGYKMVLAAAVPCNILGFVALVRNPVYTLVGGALVSLPLALGQQYLLQKGRQDQVMNLTLAGLMATSVFYLTALKRA